MSRRRTILNLDPHPSEKALFAEDRIKILKKASPTGEVYKISRHIGESERMDLLLLGVVGVHRNPTEWATLEESERKTFAFVYFVFF